MNKIPLMRKGCLLGTGACFAILTVSGMQGRLYSQETEIQQGPGSKIPVPGAYTFQMLLKPDVDLTVRVKSRLKKRGAKEENTASVSPDTITTIQRDIRPDIVRVIQDTGEKGKECTFYYTGGWCAYDDPLRGLNVRHPNMEGLLFPMDFYHFPELLWAEPRTRQPDPTVKEGAPKIQLYKDGQQTLEVDAGTGRPLRFLDAEKEWNYSYKEDPAPIPIPEKLAAALRKVLAKHKS